MRTRERSLIDPLARHGAIARQAFGLKTPRELDDETRIALEQFGQVPAKAIPRVAGPVSDPSLYEALAVLERSGQIYNETDLAPDPLPGVYYGNAGIQTSGVAPTTTGGESNNSASTAVVGTGFDFSLADATDVSGRIVLVTGTGISAAGHLMRIVFNRPKRNANYGIVLTAADSDAAGKAVYCDFGTRSVTSWVLSCTTQLAGSTSYHWDYVVIDRQSL